jgi:hypothetical protein
VCLANQPPHIFTSPKKSQPIFKTITKQLFHFSSTKNSNLISHLYHNNIFLLLFKQKTHNITIYQTHPSCLWPKKKNKANHHIGVKFIYLAQRIIYPKTHQNRSNTGIFFFPSLVLIVVNYTTNSSYLKQNKVPAPP